MRKRLGLKAQMARWNAMSREMQRAADAVKYQPRCGCPVNAPEADSSKFPCPCGDHCKDCK